MPPALTGSDVLNGPPPSPQLAGGGPTGGAGFSAGALAGPPPTTPTNQMAPEILTGVLAAAEKVGALLDQFAQVAPQLGPKFAIIKEQLQTVLAELVTAGAGPVAPGHAGPAFPAAFDRGVTGPGTQ